MSDAAAPAPTTPAGFVVELPVFTGPFRLLAELILEQKVDVCDIAVATVTDRYLAQTKDTDGWDLEEATWFLAICAVLLELKVSRLTPKHTELDEEDLLGRSPDLAYARSLELAAFRKVALENFNMSLGSGLGKIANKVFRIGHLGDFNDLMLAGTLSGVEMGLALAGIPSSKGGVAEALDYLQFPRKGKISR